MARYPVTVMEYRCFMDADGYQNDGYWKEKNSLRWRNAPLPFEESYQYQYIRLLRENKEAMLKQLDIWVKQGSYSPAQAEYFRETMNSEDDKLREQWAENESAKRDDAGKVVRPWLWDYQQYTVENQPVIGVSWYEACAYAAWLTETLQSQGLISESEEIRLPTETEWEKAARGTDGRRWPWGNEFDEANALVWDLGVFDMTAAVDSHPGGASPYGVYEMAGNTEEWTADWYDAYPGSPYKGGAFGKTFRALRGGSSFFTQNHARCAYRCFTRPEDSGIESVVGVGFRCVLDVK